MNSINKISSSRGFSLMEALVTMIIILVGLLGIAALQVKAQTAELESYQRAQALILISDIADKLNINRETATCFRITTNTTTGSPYIGVSGTASLSCTASTAAYNTQAVNTLPEIDNLLKGTTAQLSGNNVGAMIGARACISYDASTEIGGNPDTGLYTIAISWQGMSILSTPAVNCANNTYGDEGQRRTVSITTRIANLN
jgi:type IV pilus assembly protein PilV